MPQSAGQVILAVTCICLAGWSQSRFWLASSLGPFFDGVSRPSQQMDEKAWNKEKFSRIKEKLSQLDDHDLISIASNTKGDPIERIHSVILLGERRSKVAVPMLIHLVESRELVSIIPEPYELVRAATRALAKIGDERAGPVIMALARNDPLFPIFARSAVLDLGELRYEPAIPLLIEFVRSASDFLLRDWAATVLKNDFGRNDGLEIMRPLLLSDDEKEFELALNIFMAVDDKYRDAAFIDILVKAMKEQIESNRLVGLMSVLNNTDDRDYKAAHYLYSLLDDEREATEPFSRGRKATIGDFAAYYLAHLLGGKIALPNVAGNSLESSREDRQKFREAVKREATKILFAQ